MLLLLSPLAFALDTDLDGVDNVDDLCPYEDDTVDIDADGVADCGQTLLWEFGFGDEASLGYYLDASPFGGGNLVWGQDDDLNGYTAYSGAAMISNGTGDAVIEVEQCVTLHPTKSYVVTGRSGATVLDTTKVVYVLGPVFYFDPFCGQKWTHPNMWGLYSIYFDYTENYGSTPVDLGLAFSPPPGAQSMRVRAYSYIDGYAPRFWFDSLAVHVAGEKGLSDHPTGPPDKR